MGASIVCVPENSICCFPFIRSLFGERRQRARSRSLLPHSYFLGGLCCQFALLVASHVEDESCRDDRLLHFLKGVIDILQVPGLINHFRATICVQFEDFRQVQAGSHNGAHDLDAIEHGFEDRQLHVVICWQCDKDQRSSTSKCAEGLLEGTRRNSQTDGRVSSAQLLYGLHWIFCLAVYCIVCAQLLCQLQLLVNQVDCDNGSPSNLGILQGQVAQPTDAEDGHQVGGAGSADLDRFIGRDPSACQGSSLQGIHLCRYFGDISGEGGGIFGIGSGKKIAGIASTETERLPAGYTVLAGATGIAQPGDGNPVSLFDVSNPCSNALDDPHAFMTRNEGKCGLDRPISMGGVNICMAQARGFNFDDDLPWFRFWLGDVLQAERGGEAMYDCCFHCFLSCSWHKNTLLYGTPKNSSIKDFVQGRFTIQCRQP